MQEFLNTEGISLTKQLLNRHGPCCLVKPIVQVSRFAADKIFR